MQQDKITDLPELAIAAAEDVLEITDVSTSTSNKIQAHNLGPAVVAGIPAGGLPQSLLSAIPFCRVLKNSAGSVTSGVATALAFDAEVTDTNGMWSSGSKVVIATAGVYTISGTISYVAVGSTTGYREASLRLNATEVAAQRIQVSSGFSWNVSVSTSVSLATGAEVELYALHTQGSNVNVTGSLSVVYNGSSA